MDRASPAMPPTLTTVATISQRASSTGYLRGVGGGRRGLCERDQLLAPHQRAHRPHTIQRAGLQMRMIVI
jgi:hypothetical protein